MLISWGVSEVRLLASALTNNVPMNDVITISRLELKRMLDAQRDTMLNEMEHLVTRALTRAAEASGHTSPTISQAEAFRVYTRRRVERWLALGKLRPLASGKGNRKFYSVEQLQNLAKTSIFSA